jgi:hypothetical protein
MNVLREFRIPSRLLVIGLTLILGIPAQGQPMDMKLSISFESVWEPEPWGSMHGGLRLTIRWGVVPEGTFCQ